jgi:hypothetical protein
MKNESRIREQLCKVLNVKSEKANFNHLTDIIKTSVDFKINLGGINFLIEVDSNNVAKIIFGQYLLLNKAKDLPQKPFLIIIHCYDGYNIERTNKHLDYAKEVYGCFIPYMAFAEKEWINNTVNKSKDDLEKYLISLANK